MDKSKGDLPDITSQLGRSAKPLDSAESQLAESISCLKKPTEVTQDQKGIFIKLEDTLLSSVAFTNRLVQRQGKLPTSVNDLSLSNIRTSL